MKKKICLGIATMSLVFLMSTSAFAANMNFTIDGIKRNFEVTNVENGITTVPYDQLGQSLNLQYNFDRNTQVITYFNNTTKLTMKIETTKTTVSKSDQSYTKTAPIAPKIVDSKILVPLRFVSEVFENKVGWDQNTSAVTIATKNEYVSSLKEIDDHTLDAKVYTYKQALESAISNNQNMKTLQSSVQNMQSNYEKLINNTNVNIISAQSTSAILNLRSQQNYILTADSSIKATKAAIEVGLRSAITNVQVAKLTIVTTEKNMALEQTNLKNTKLRFELGMASQNDVTNLENKIAASNASLAKLKSNLATAQQNLNQIMGVPLTQNTYVPFDTTIKHVDINIEQVLAGAMSGSRTIVADQNALDVAQYAIDIYIDDNNSQPLEVLKNNVADARGKLGNDRAALEATVRKTVQGLADIEIAASSLQSALDSAILNYNTAFINYQTGNITKYELDQAELGILSAEVNIFSNNVAYNNLLFQIQNPATLG